jgi:hypothetical protein
MRGDRPGIGRLGDRGHRAAMVGKIFHLSGRGAGVGGNRNGAEFDAGEPGQHRLDTIIQMDQQVFARPDATRLEPRGKRADPLVEFTVGPDPRRRLERRPDQKRVIASGLAAHPQQPWHVHPCEWPHHARCWP